MDMDMDTNRELLLIRGLPGSGKTTMAKKYAQAGYVHCEADPALTLDVARSTHRVYRGNEWLPCYCAADFDHKVGHEQERTEFEASND